MALRMLGMIIVIFIILLIVVKFVRYEGYENDYSLDPDKKAHNTFNKKFEKRHNRIGSALLASNNIGVIGENTQSLFGNTYTTMDETGKSVQNIDNPYPLEKGKNDLFHTIDKCENVTSADCNAFDDPEFSSKCGMCLELGKNSRDKPTLGGLVISGNDKKFADESARGGYIPDYEPTIGRCPAGRFVTTKAQCIRLKNQLDCAKGNTFNTPEGCSQCFSDGSYSVVDKSAQADLIRGSGTLFVTGFGNMVFSESGYGNMTIQLSDKPRMIPLGGAELNTISMKIMANPEPVVYDNFTIYKVGDRVIFNNDIYTMVDSVGQPGYAPNRPGDTLYQKLSSLDTFIPDPPISLAGYISGDTASGTFALDLYRIVINDSLTGRKPSVNKMIPVNGQEVSNMVPGYGKKGMSLVAKSPFTFVDQYSQEASLCPSSPFITKPDSAKHLQSDPCYKADSGPGKYSKQCLQNVFLNNGCTENGSAYPTTAKTVSDLMYNADGTARGLSDIADVVYAQALVSATGLSATGKSLSLRDWSESSVFCTGKAISSPCDVADRDTGPLSNDCLIYLWDNQGENKKTGATYGIMSFANSMFGTGKVRRFCTRSGLLSPKDLDNKDNKMAISYWKKVGGVDDVKRAMSKLHMDANDGSIPEDNRKEKISQCYGVVPEPRAVYKPPYTSDTEVTLAPKPVIICPSGIKYTKLGEFRLGLIVGQPCHNINNPQYKNDGWIFIGNATNWTKITDGQRNETWAHVQLTAKDLGNKNVINPVSQVASRLKIPDRIGQQPEPYINYLIKHKTKNSSVTLNKCGFINDIRCRQGAIVGMYMGNNWSTQYKATNGQYVVDLISNPVGTPLMGEDDIYELYFGVTTDICTPDPTDIPAPTPLPRRGGGPGWNM